MATATWVLISVYVALILFFVIRGARRTRSMSDYAVGSFQFSPIAVGLSLAASMTSAATFVINPGFVTLYGISGVISFGLVLPAAAIVSLVVLTKGFRKHGNTVKAITISQWIGSRYGSRAYSLFFAVLSLLLITFVVLICVALTKTLAPALGVDQVYVLMGVIGLIFGYMMFGGANSLVYTNTIQAVLMLIVAVILLGSGYEHFKDGVDGFLAKLAAIDPMLVETTNPESLLFRDWFEIIFCQIVIGAAIVCQPHIITKSLFIKDDKDVNRFLAVGIAAEVLFFLVVFAGLYVRIRFPDMTFEGNKLPMDELIPTYVIQEFPVWMALLVVLGLISAGISTLEGLIQALSTTLTNDLIDPLVGHRLFSGPEGEYRKVLVNRGVIICLAAVSFGFSYQQLLHPALSVGIFAQNGVYAFFSAAIVPVIFGMFLEDTPIQAPIAASVTAVIVHFTVYYGGITSYMKNQINNPAIAATFAILCALAVGGAVYFVVPRRQSATDPAVATDD